MTILTQEQVQTIMQANPSATTFEFPEGVTSIGDRAFFGCSGLTTIQLPEGMTSIGDEAFSGYSGLTSINIPESVTSIRDSTFEGCSGLTSIQIPEGTESIGMDVFENCNHLEHIIAPAHLHEQLNRQYPDKTVMTLQQACGEKVHQHTPASLRSEKLTEMVRRLSPAAKTSFGPYRRRLGAAFMKCLTVVVDYVT